MAERREPLDEQWRQGLAAMGLHRARGVWHLTKTNGAQLRGVSIRNPYGRPEAVGIVPDRRVNTPECYDLGEAGGEYRFATREIVSIERVIDPEKQVLILYPWTADALAKAAELAVPFTKAALLRHLAAWGETGEHSAAYELSILSDEEWERLDLWGWRTEEVGEVFEVTMMPENTLGTDAENR